MKKEILLLWFGDTEPSYAQWNVENFKKMNPRWEVNYGSDCQLKDYSMFTKYARKYVSLARHACICCNIQCFPIMPFDKFMSLTHFSVKYNFENSKYVISNIRYSINYILQIQKNIDLHKPIVVHQSGIYINDDAQLQLDSRVQAFKACRLDVNSNPFCAKFFSPVENLGLA